MATGEEPITGPQRSHLQTLCREAGEEFDPSLTKAEASKKIEELQAKIGRADRNAILWPEIVLTIQSRS